MSDVMLKTYCYQRQKLLAVISNAILMIVTVLILNFPNSVYADPVCGPEVKQEVADLLSEAEQLPLEEKKKMVAELYDKYFYCSKDVQFNYRTPFPIVFHKEENSFNILDTDAEIKSAAKQCSATVSQIGSLYYEEMSCCGYDPQRRQFACPVKIKQTFGFGGSPLPGSREYVLHCVADPTTGALVPVGRDSVHLANEMFNFNPPWQFAVIANANNNLQTIYPMSGQTRRARSILSWGFEPTSCNFQPIWGNALNYQIRLDQ